MKRRLRAKPERSHAAHVLQNLVNVDRLCRAIGRSSENISIRSTRATMRSVSSQISRVNLAVLRQRHRCSKQLRRATDATKAGFLSSWASMAAMAVTERAAFAVD